MRLQRETDYLQVHDEDEEYVQCSLMNCLLGQDHGGKGEN